MRKVDTYDPRAIVVRLENARPAGAAVVSVFRLRVAIFLEYLLNAMLGVS